MVRMLNPEAYRHFIQVMLGAMLVIVAGLPQESLLY